MKSTSKNKKSKLSIDRNISIYTDFVKEYPVQKNTVFYHAYRTMIMAGNPFAIFKTLIEDEKYKEFQHIWVYNSEESLEYDTFKRYKVKPNVKLVKANTEEHLKALATCEYFVENAALPSYWVKRPGQVYINTWHGTPLKTLGKSAKDFNRDAISNAQRNFLMCDYLVMPNRYAIDKIVDSYDLEGLASCNIVDAGYPRNDLVLNTNHDRIRSLLEKKSRVSLKNKKIVLYAPTFRSKQGKSLDTSQEVCDYIEYMVEQLPDDYVMFFKVHNTLGRFFKGKTNIENRLIFDEIETNELLSVTDVLITDYSSIFFDFLCTGRPILFFVYDRKEYEDEHGMYLSLDTMPGSLCYTPQEVINQIQNIKNGSYYCEQYKKNAQQFAYNDDGHACKRVCDLVFGKKESDYTYKMQKSNKKNMLISLKNHLSTSCMELLYMVLGEIDFNKYQVIIAANELERIAGKCAKINPQIRIIASKIIFNADSKEQNQNNLDDAFYLRQKEKFFYDIKFDVYLNLKEYDTAKIDQIFAKLSDVKKYWIFNAYSDVQRYLLQKQWNYEEIYVFCKDKKEAIVDDKSDCKILDCEDIRKISKGKMTILCLTAFDSMNYTLAACIEELESRGHRAIVLVRDTNDSINNRIFAEKNIDAVSVKDFNTKTLNFVDAVLSAPPKFNVYRRIYAAISSMNLFVCSFSTLFSSIVMRINPDVVFCLGKNKFDEFKENNLRYNCVAVGNPQYDSLIEKKKPVENNAIKQVLIVDQGGYPYGKVGKQQLADTLVRLANQNADMIFTVKPRYVPGEQGQTLHLVSEHLYDYLNDIPDNLLLMTEPTVLEDIVDQYDAMITTWSTAYLDALMLDMPVIFIAGLDSVDVFDVRKYRVEDAYRYLEKTGCVYDYRELGDLKSQFRVIDREYIRNEVYEYDRPSADKVVDFLEFCNEKLIVKNLRFDQFFSYTLNEFYENYDSIKKADVSSNHFQIRTKALNAFNDLMQEYVYMNRCMGGLMNLSKLEQFYDMEFNNTEDQDEFVANMSENLKMCYEDIQKEFFSCESAQKQIREDKVLQDFYFDWAYSTGQYDAIKNYEGSLLAEESREYYLALIYLPRRKKEAYTHLFNFLEISLNNEVKQLLKERRLMLSLKPFREGIVKKLYFYYYIYKKKQFKIVEYYDQSKVRKNAAATWMGMKDYNRSQNFVRSLEIYEQYNKNYKVQKKRKKNISQKFKFILKKIANIAVEREYRTAKKGLAKNMESVLNAGSI